MPNDSREFLTIGELAERWRCSERHIYDLIAGRQLVARNIGRKRYVIAAEDAEQFIEARRTVKAAA